MEKVYLDNGATTKIDSKVLDAMMPFLKDNFGNASSMHSWGEDAREAIENSREIIANSLNAQVSEIVFTSGGTESNNFAIKGVAFANRSKGNHIITSKIDHDCVLDSCKWLSTQGFEVTYLNVDNEGFVDLEQLRKSIKDTTILVSIIHGNNEIGTIQDLDKIGEICKQKKVLLHSDACQSYTKIPLDVKKTNIDLLTINAHKIHGPKGVGALFIKKGTIITPLFNGGGHEFKKRAGTENVPGIVGFGKAVEISKEIDFAKMAHLRDYSIKKIQDEIKDSILTGAKDTKWRLQNNINFIFKYIEGEGILMHLNMAGIAVSTGSACSSHSLEPSHVMIALGYSHELSHGSIRMTISKDTKKEDIDYTVEKLKATVDRLRSMSPIAR